jgi:hypothetical protein
VLGRKLALALGLGLMAAGALAASNWVNIEQRLTPQQMHETGLDLLSPVQLARLNQLLRNDMQAGSVDAAAVKRSAAAPDGSNGGFIGMDAEPIRTKLVGSVSGWQEGTEFHLANGQAWKVLKGSMKLRKMLDSPDVLLVPGVMGRWFLQIDEDAPKARVYRID